jgi:hypothetical protein
MDYAMDKSTHLVSLVGYTTVWTLQNDAGGKKNSIYAPFVAKAKSRLCIHVPSRILNGCPIIHYLLGCNQARSHGGAMHPLQIWVHLLGVSKICQGQTCWSARCKTCGTPLSPRVASVEPSWLETTLLQKCMHVQNARNVIGSTILFNYWFCCPDKRAFYAYAYTHTQYIYNSIIHVYKRMFVYAPLLEAAAPTVFMVWLLAWL